MIPVMLLTGFLGSGKTTLLSTLLKESTFSSTAVIVNEFGEIGLDHELVQASDDSIVQLTTGCVCCVARDDLALSLTHLLEQRQKGAITAYDRVVIETSGIADPTGTAQMLLRDRVISQSYQLENIVTVVDVTTANHSLKTQPECVKQVALADRILLSKTDVHDGATASLTNQLQKINPTAMLTDRWQIDDLASWLLTGPHHRPTDQAIESNESRIDDWLGHPSAPAGKSIHSPSTFSIVRDEPVPAAALSLFLEALSEHNGPNLLRLKGIVCLREDPDKPVVIHGIQHIFHTPMWLASWPESHRQTRLVFIGYQLDKQWTELLLDAIVAEVDEVQQVNAAK